MGPDAAPGPQPREGEEGEGAHGAQDLGRHQPGQAVSAGQHRHGNVSLLMSTECWTQTLKILKSCIAPVLKKISFAVPR